MLDIELTVPVQARLNLTLLVLAGTRVGGVPVTLTTSSSSSSSSSSAAMVTPSLDGVPFWLGAKEVSLALRVVVDVVTGR